MTSPSAEALAEVRNLAGKIMLLCGVRGMSKEHGQLQDLVEAEINLAIHAAEVAAYRAAAKAVCRYCDDPHGWGPVREEAAGWFNHGPKYCEAARIYARCPAALPSQP